MKKLLYTFLFVILLLVFIIIRDKRIYNKEVNNYQNQLEESNIKINSLLSNTIYYYKHNGLSLDFINDSIFKNNCTIRLDELVDIGPKLFIYYSYNNCTICIDRLMKDILKIFDSFDKVVMIGNFKDANDATVLSNTYNIDVYNINDTDSRFPTNNQRDPILFILDKNFRMNQPHIAYKSTRKLTIEYLKNIKTRYLNDNNDDMKYLNPLFQF